MEKTGIYESIVNIMGEIGAIGKNQRNTHQGFKFRGIDDVYNHAQPLFAKHGVFTVPLVLEDRTEERVSTKGGTLIYRILTMQYRFYATDGSFVEARVIGEGMDSGDKAANKAMAVAHKYAILQVLQIPTEDMIDPDSESPEASRRVEPKTTKAPEERVPEEKTPFQMFRELVDMSGDEEKVKDILKAIGVQSSSGITPQAYETVAKKLRMDR